MENKEKIFTKFINFIKRIFGKEETKQIPAKTEVITKQPESNFLDEIRLYKKEDSTLLKLQNQYEKNEIDLCIMSNEQIRDLNSLYKRQVSELKQKLNDKKTELSAMQNKIKNYTTNI